MERLASIVMLGLCLLGTPVLAVRDHELSKGNKDCLASPCPCKGTNSLDRYRSTCPKIELDGGVTSRMRCYSKSKLSEHAASGEDGECHIAKYKPCSESLGGCRGGTICRSFIYLEKPLMGNAEFKQGSYCVLENLDATQNPLDFLGNAYHVTPANLNALKDTLESTCTGTCPEHLAEENGEHFELKLKCFKKDSTAELAGKKEEGVCLVPRRSQCAQRTPGDALSGGCQGETACATYRYLERTSSKLKELGSKSICINEDDFQTPAEKLLKQVGVDVVPAKDVRPGDPCWGASDFDVFRMGSCPDPKDTSHKKRMECFSLADPFAYAKENEAGRCLFTIGKKCEQNTRGDINSVCSHNGVCIVTESSLNGETYCKRLHSMDAYFSDDNE